jgi:hypothetical protein
MPCQCLLNFGISSSPTSTVKWQVGEFDTHQKKMFPFYRKRSLRSINSRSTLPLQIEVQVETEVHSRSEDVVNENSHGSVTTASPPSHSSLLPPTTITRNESSTMSLPRSNYDPRRVCLNPFPALSFGKHRRTIGVYLAGALVRRHPTSYNTSTPC